jgi:hypothetical protein
MQNISRGQEGEGKERNGRQEEEITRGQIYLTEYQG